MKRHIESILFLIETQLFKYHTPNGILFKQKDMMKGICLYDLFHNIKTQTESKEELETFT